MPKLSGTDQFGREEERQSLFREHPPFSMAMACGLFVLLIAVVAVVGAYLVRVPETIRCPFVLVSEGNADPVRSTATGYLETVAAEERRPVSKGQVLFVIRAREMRAWLTERRSWSSELEAAENELAGFESRRALRQESRRGAVEIQQAKMRQIDEDLAYQRKYYATYKDLLQRYEMLDKEGLLPPLDMLSHRAGAAKAERDVSLAQQNRQMADLELKQVQTEYQKLTAQDDLEMRRTAVRIAGLKQQMQGNPAEAVPVKAPFDGVVVTLERRAPGDAVSEGQELCRIARTDSPLVAELAPPEEATPRLAPGQPVQLFYHAFPYQRYGTAEGTLRWLSPVTMHSDGGDRFVARVALRTQVVLAGGEPQPLKAGMKGEGRVIVGRRSLIEYAFDPIRRLRENLSPPK